MILRIRKNIPAIFFSFVTFLGLLNIPNVGISWDEAGQRLSAGLSLINVVQMVDPNLVPSNYGEFTSTASDLSRNGAVDHGVAFDAPILIMETLFRINSTRDIYLLHHTVNWLAFMLGVIALYLFASRRHDSRKIGLLASTFLILSPRILGEGFYNSKDITFMCFLLLSNYFVFKWISQDSNKYRNAFFAGVIGGYATDIRILGLIQVFLIFITLVFQAFYLRNAKYQLKPYFVYLVSFLVTMYIFYPYLWRNPIQNLITVFSSMSHYGWDAYVLYAGSRVSSTQLPWHYLLGWILVTTPVIYLILFGIGLTSVLGRLIYRQKLDENFIFDFFILINLVIPMSIIILLKSTLYDGWRHVYFVYPYLLLIAVSGIVFISRKLSSKKVKNALSVAVAGSLVYLSIWVVVNSPIQNIYFNVLAGSDIKNNWEMDYWGLGNEQALRFILTDSNYSKVSVQEVSFTPLSESAKMLSASDSSLLIFETSTVPSADYLVNNFRSGTKNPIKSKWPGYFTIKTFSAGNAEYLEILKRIK